MPNRRKKEEILSHPEVADAVNKLSEAGASQEIVDNVVNTAISSIPVGGTAKEAVEIVSHCILKKIREFESTHDPKTGAGRFIKKIFD